MGDRLQVGLRYCGGCNPRYDRVALVQKLGSFFPETEFVSAAGGNAYPAVLVICGCASRCAKVEDLSVPGGRLIYLSGWEDLLPAKKALQTALAEWQQETRTLTHQQVLDILPHRDPMLFIDEVSSLNVGREIAASYYVRPDLPVFAGHFPDEPMLPGVLAVEAGAQAADILLLTMERYQGKLPLFMSIRKANFRRKIRPGDTLTIRAALKEERAELGMAVCRVQVLVEEAVCAEMELSLALRAGESTSAEGDSRP